MAQRVSVRFVLITPARRVLEASADFVAFSAHDGEIGILPRRAPLMCELGIGQFRYQSGTQVRRLFIDGGFAQVLNNEVTVLTQQAIPAEEITPQTIAEAERRVSELRGTDAQTLEARALAQRRLRALHSLQAGG